MSNLDHPSEEALERFLLHDIRGHELVRLEGHILACERCIACLEDIELDVAATKLALRHICKSDSNFVPYLKAVHPLDFR